MPLHPQTFTSEVKSPERRGMLKIKSLRWEHKKTKEKNAAFLRDAREEAAMKRRVAERKLLEVARRNLVRAAKRAQTAVEARSQGERAALVYVMPATHGDIERNAERRDDEMGDHSKGNDGRARFLKNESREDSKSVLSGRIMYDDEGKPFKVPSLKPSLYDDEGNVVSSVKSSSSEEYSSSVVSPLLGLLIKASGDGNHSLLSYSAESTKLPLSSLVIPQSQQSRCSPSGSKLSNSSQCSRSSKRISNKAGEESSVQSEESEAVTIAHSIAKKVAETLSTSPSNASSFNQIISRDAGPKYYVATVDEKGRANVISEAVMPAMENEAGFKAEAKKRGYDVTEYHMCPKQEDEKKEKKSKAGLVSNLSNAMVRLRSRERANVIHEAATEATEDLVGEGKGEEEENKNDDACRMGTVAARLSNMNVRFSDDDSFFSFDTIATGANDSSVVSAGSKSSSGVSVLTMPSVFAGLSRMIVGSEMSSTIAAEKGCNISSINASPCVGAFTDGGSQMSSIIAAEKGCNISGIDANPCVGAFTEGGFAGIKAYILLL